MFKPAHNISSSIINNRFFYTCSDGPIFFSHSKVIILDSADGTFFCGDKIYFLQNLIINNV